MDDHEFAVLQERLEKDHWFRESHDSPVPHELRHAFSGLTYFPFDPAFRFRAVLQVNPKEDVLTFATSTGTEQRYLRHGYFELVIAGQAVRLHAYKPVHSHGPPSLFLPFRDATSGKETYGAGRYLDLEPAANDVYDLDFNRAYNPYCAYSDEYVCPLPPPENWLSVSIPAGERSWQH